jgi:type I restriction enzyme S subunit
VSRWKEAPLSKICSLIGRGITPKYIDERGVLVINQKCIRNHVVTYDLGRRHDAGQKLPKPDRMIAVGDVLVNSTGTGTLGRVAQVRSALPEPATVDAHVTIVRPTHGLFYPGFFGYAMISLEAKLAASGQGASAQTELARTTIEEFSIAFPETIEEQQRIVAVLDEAFAAIATASANTEKNVALARELPSSALIESGFSSELIQRRRLGSLVARLTNGYVGPTRDIYVEKGIPYLLGRNVRDNVLDFDGRTFVSHAFNEKNEKSKLKAGDVLLVQSGHIGHSAVVSPQHAGHNCHGMIIITPIPGILGDYISAYLNSAEGREATACIRTGSTVPHLTCRDVKELQIPVPSLEVQGLLLVRHRKIIASSQELVQTYLNKVAALTALKKSLMNLAFSGKLTDTSLETIAA